MEHPNQLWSLDFVEDALADGRQLRTLTVVGAVDPTALDVYSRECPQIEVDTSLPSARVVRVLESLAAQRQLPERLLVDNGPQFVCRTLAEWAERRGVQIAFTRPGKPTDKPHIESFNGKFRDECLNAHYFLSVPDARRLIEAWRLDYNHHRPHSALGGATPMEFLQQVTAVQATAEPERQ